MASYRQILQTKVDYINRRLNEDYVIDHYSPGGNPYTYCLVKVVEGGGHRVISGNGRMTFDAFKNYLNGFIDGLERVM